MARFFFRELARSDGGEPVASGVYFYTLTTGKTIKGGISEKTHNFYFSTFYETESLDLDPESLHFPESSHRTRMAGESGYDKSEALLLGFGSWQ